MRDRRYRLRNRLRWPYLGTATISKTGLAGCERQCGKVQRVLPNQGTRRPTQHEGDLLHTGATTPDQTRRCDAFGASASRDARMRHLGPLLWASVRRTRCRGRTQDASFWISSPRVVSRPLAKTRKGASLRPSLRARRVNARHAFYRDARMRCPTSPQADAFWPRRKYQVGMYVLREVRETAPTIKNCRSLLGREAM